MTARRRRSVHFVPGGNEKMIAKALTLEADGLILDLEDAVPPDRKAATRARASATTSGAGMNAALMTGI